MHCSSWPGLARVCSHDWRYYVCLPFLTIYIASVRGCTGKSSRVGSSICTMTIPLLSPHHERPADAAQWVVQHVQHQWIAMNNEVPGDGSQRRVVVVSGSPDAPHAGPSDSVVGAYMETDYLELFRGEWNPDRVETVAFNVLSMSLAESIRRRTESTVVIDTRQHHFSPFASIPSPTIAVMIAVGLSATELQFLGQRDGVFTADPARVSMAQLLPVLSIAEWEELAAFDEDQANNPAIKQALRRNIPVRIQNACHGAGAGTLVHPDPDIVARKDPPAVACIQGRKVSDFAAHGRPDRGPRAPTAVAIKEHVHILDIGSHHRAGTAAVLPDIFNVLNRFGVAAELMSTSKVHVSVVVQLGAGILQQLLCELEKCGMSVSVREEMAVLSLVGRHMPSMIGIAGHMFSALAKRNVNIEMMSQSASEMNISCVISGRDAVKALNIVHHACLSGFSGSPGECAKSIQAVLCR
ncbi:aspartate kinase [Pleurotus pulmonarius]